MKRFFSKRNIIIFSVLIILILLFLFVNFFIFSKKEETYKVTFITNTNEKIRPIIAKKNRVITLPDNLKNDGYIFYAWSLDGKYISDDFPLRENITLTANWISDKHKKYKITFDSKGGSKVKSLTIYKDYPISFLPDATKDGYEFVSWTTKKGNEVTNDDVLNKDITLYAKYKKLPYKYVCEKGFKLKDGKCTKTEKTPTTTLNEFSCGEGFELSNEMCRSKKVTKSDLVIKNCDGKIKKNSDETVTCTSTKKTDATVTYKCDKGGSNKKNKKVCIKKNKKKYNAKKVYSCKEGKLNNKKCEIKSTEKIIPQYGCPEDYFQKGNKCVKTTVTIMKAVKKSSKSCPEGFKLKNSRCSRQIVKDPKKVKIGE